MPVTAIDIAVLATIARYYLLTREQVQLLCAPQHRSGRAMRKRLSKLRHAGYINKHRLPVAFGGETGAPVYYATAKGAQLLASYYDDDSFLATNTRTPRADRLPHWIAINESRIVIERVVKSEPAVTLSGWLTEWETINKSAPERERFCIHTQLRNSPPLSCSPDAAFLLSIAGHSKVFYVERDLGTSSPRQVAARKTSGYKELARRALHRKHFPETTLNEFSILVITTRPLRRDAIQKAITKQKTAANLWLFTTQEDLPNFLREPVVLDHNGELGPLVKVDFLGDKAG